MRRLRRVISESGLGYVLPQDVRNVTGMMRYLDKAPRETLALRGEIDSGSEGDMDVYEVAKAYEEESGMATNRTVARKVKSNFATVRSFKLGMKEALSRTSSKPNPDLIGMIKLEQYMRENDLWTLDSLRDSLYLSEEPFEEHFEIYNIFSKAAFESRIFPAVQDQLVQRMLHMPAFAYIREYQAARRNGIPGAETCTVEQSVAYVQIICETSRLNMCTLAFYVFATLTKLFPKRNGLSFTGESNAGKSLLARSIVRLFPVFGEIRPSGNTEFAYMDMVNKPVCLCEEPVIDPTQVEHFKLILGGEETNVHVKHKAPKALKRTPLILTGNQPIWTLCQGERVPLENRLVGHLKMVHCPALKACAHELNPRMWLFLFDYFAVNEPEVCMKRKQKRVASADVTQWLITQDA